MAAGSSEELQSFTNAVLASFDPQADPALRRGANASLDALKQAEDGWRFCFRAFGACPEPQVKFWCLQTLVSLATERGGERYASLPETSKAEIRATLMAWVQAKGAMETDEPPFIKNKFAQLVVGIMCTDYPHAWPQVFTQLLGLLPNGPVVIDLFLRVLNTVHEEVVSAEGSGHDFQLANRIKDGMREGCLPQVVAAWQQILSLHESAPQLAAACLHTMHLYVSWIDIGLVTTPPLMAMLYAFVSSGATHENACLCLTEMVVKRMDVAAKVPHLQRLDIVRVLAEAGANAAVTLTAPIATLASSVALELLDCWDRLSQRTPEGMAPAEQAALASQAALLLRQTIPLLLRCLEADDLDASQSSLSFLHSYVGRLRKLLPTQQLLAEHEPQMEQLLQALSRKSLHPEDFNFDVEDEGEATFLAYRRELATLFKGVARLSTSGSSVALDFVGRLLQQTAAKPEGTPFVWRHLEVALWLLYQLGEGLPESAMRDRAGPLHAMMEAVVGFSSHHHHQAVQVLYLELLVRYNRFFPMKPQHLGGALSAFLDERGVYSSRRDVRAKACDLLRRFIKHTLKAASPAVLDAIVSRLLALLLLQQQPPHALTGVAPLGVAPTAATAGAADGGVMAAAAGGGAGAAAPPGPHDAGGRQLPLSDAEQMNLYEACGVLLGAGLVAPQRASELLGQILQLPLQQLQSLCAQVGALAQQQQQGAGAGAGAAGGDAGLEQMLAAGAAAAAQHIAVVAVISKGFSNLATPGGNAELFAAQQPVREAFSSALGLSLAALHGFGKFADVRTSALMLMHRMTETLSDEGVVGVLGPAVPALLHSAEGKEVVEVARLVNQLVLKFKGRIAAAVSPMVAPVSATIFSHVGGLDAAIAAETSAAALGAKAGGPQSQQERERYALLRGYYGLLHSLVHNELLGVMHDEHNGPYLQQALRVLIDGCTEGPDLQVQQQCVLILHRLVEQWCGAAAATPLPGFDGFVLQQVLPVCFSALTAPHFSLSNAAAVKLLDALVALQQVMLARLGAQLVPYLRDTHLPSLGCEPAFCAQYVALLAEGEPRQLRDFMVQNLGGSGRASGASASGSSPPLAARMMSQ